MSFGALSGSNLQAVDRVVKIVRELDRYHGFVAAERRCGLPVAPEAPEDIVPWLEAHIAKRSRPQMAPQRLEKIESAPGNGMAPEGSSPQDLAPACEPLVSPAAAKPSGARRVSLRMTLNGVRGLLEAGSVSDDVVARKGNFPPRKPLISHETGKESRSAIRFGDSLGKSARGGVRRERRHQHFRNSGRPCYPPAFPPGVMAPSRATPHENRRT